jgi:predicted ATPase
MLEEGLRVLTDALLDIQKEGGSFYEAEIHRLRGELTLQLGSREQRAKDSEELGVNSKEQGVGSPEQRAESREQEAEGYFLKAIAIAQKQQAKSLELRAVMSLARLWQNHGKTAEARRMLAEIYDWFTEGFDTKDLQEAKALLAEVSH